MARIDFLFFNFNFSANGETYQACQYCPFSLCKRAIPTTSYLRQDTLVAARIWPQCSAGCNKYMGSGVCNCTEYIMKPLHFCESDGGHLCNSCFNGVASSLLWRNVWEAEINSLTESIVRSLWTIFLRAGKLIMA